MTPEFFWNRIPFFRLLIPFLGGIIFQIYLQSEIPGLLPVLCGLAVLLILALFIKKIAASYRFRFVFGALLTLILFFTGIALVNLKTGSRDSTQFSNINTGRGFYYVRLNEPWLEKDRSLKVVMDVLAVKKGNSWIPSTGKAMFYLHKDSLSLRLRYGDCLVVNTSFSEIPPPKNPSEFNYRQYLYFHNVYSQAYVRAGDWKFTGANEGSVLLRWSYALRDRLLGILTENNFTGDEFAVTAALVLGYEDKLDADIVSAYASTGALHVLSVSGLHVGIIYFVFNLLFSFLDKRKRGPVIKTFLLLFIVWFYATLTGLSPSVLRSAAMFTFIIVARGFRFHTDIFNTLAVSCFALLLFDPFLVMEVGFQLSFLAVFGIIFLQPRIYDLWHPVNRLLNWVWALTSVSIAAQLVTFPLGLLYFHQFPNLFLFSNLVVIPVSTIVLYLGILLFFVYKIAFIGAFAAKLLFWSVWLLNASVKFMEQLPYSILQGISITIFETWLLYFMLSFLTAFFFYRKKKYITYCLCMVIFILLIQVQQNFTELRQKRIIVYSTPKTTAIDLISGKQDVFIADSALLANNSRMLFHVKHNWWDSGLEDLMQIVHKPGMNFKNEVMSVKMNFIQFYDKRIAIVDSLSCIPDSLAEKLKVDYLLVTGGPKIKMKQVLAAFMPSLIIFDNSNPEWRIRRWKEECGKLHAACYDVSSEGAFVQDI